MNLEFRLCTQSDINEVVDLCNECFSENTIITKALSIFNTSINNPNDIYIIGLIDNIIVSHSKITIIDTIYENIGRYAIINHFCVKKEYRRQGIATKMLKYIETICQDKKCKNIELWSKNFRVPAHQCYKKNGFILEDAGFFSKKIGE